MKFFESVETAAEIVLIEDKELLEELAKKWTQEKKCTKQTLRLRNS